jgi:ATP-dependent helicase HrpB
MKQFEKIPLPIDAHIQEVMAAVRDHPTVLVKASPGSGKTTRLPWALARGLGKNVVVLEPRRLAAKLAALRIAEEEGLDLGKEVGYHFRFEKNVSRETRLTFYTEGTFLKRFLGDPALDSVDVVILDEFHERHLDTDLALAFLRSLQARRELRLVLMSATLDLELLTAFPEARAIEIQAPHYPVSVAYLPNVPSELNRPLEAKVRRAVDESAGDTLVFLPGMREMLRTAEALRGDYDVHLLHADLEREEQARALGPGKRRRVILATNIAESSVTIPGITTVIDAGVQREARYSPWNGLKFIQDVPCTQASAIQRAGRAGRTGPGACLRLYSQQDFLARPAHTVPELERADLTDTYLLVAATPLAPRWFHRPPEAKWEKARELLHRLGALDDDALTETGRKMLRHPLDARLARILVAGEDLVPREKEALVRYVTEEIEGDRTGTLRRRLGAYQKLPGNNAGPWEKCLLAGFVDQVARFRRSARDFVHYSGKVLKAHPTLFDLTDGLYIVFDITQKQEALKVLAVAEEWIWELAPFPLREEDEIVVDDRIGVTRKTKLGSIVIEEAAVKVTWETLPGASREKLLQLVRARVRDLVKRWKETETYGRLAFWARSRGANLDELVDGISLADYFAGAGLGFDDFPDYLRRYAEDKLEAKNLAQLLPTKLNLGGRRELTVFYPANLDPYLEAPIQDFYGICESPRILNGSVPLQLKLLGPHKRPIQVTKDLRNFWAKTYPEMKRVYQRDYPRHYWPDDPASAKPFLLKSHLPKA